MRTASLRANWTSVEQFCEYHGLAYRVDRVRAGGVLIDTFTGEVAAWTPKAAVALLRS